ncbi:hypothetical protein CLK_A0204 (plasmid) [Clostridium botulinum A3 str. Loch Maree]|uniref:hypothetical protein n=1 Tax=Clostridium botulinum TaxID=1491 RepID=UPI00016DBB35|nr:hypothetical protein [Clostridium botulinum]ACA57415.1 hypothetical protein CLK_A0204 [Clostridium botulinum A3 str. Loch Maree]
MPIKIKLLVSHNIDSKCSRERVKIISYIVKLLINAVDKEYKKFVEECIRDIKKR